jgi:hypothetical protein
MPPRNGDGSVWFPIPHKVCDLNYEVSPPFFYQLILD